MSVESGFTGLMINVPRELYKKFRMAVIQDDETVKGVVLDFLRVYVNEAENEKIGKDSKTD